MFARIIKQSFLYWLIIVAGVYALLPFILIAPYNQPSADDFSGAVRDAHQSFSAVFIDTYMHWSGRYFATVISRINPLLYHSFTAYKWYAVIMLAAFVAALVILIRQLTCGYSSWVQTVSLSSLLLILYLAVMPGTAEGFYWFSGAYIYQTANVFFMLLMALLVKLQKGPVKHAGLIYFPLALIMTVCIIGCNEISLIITCAIILFVLMNKYLVHKIFDLRLNILVVTCVIAACAAVFAPGNFERMNSLQEYSKSPLWTLAGAAGVTLVYIKQWSVQLLIATVLYVPLFGQALAKKMNGAGVENRLNFTHTCVFFIVLFLLLQLFTLWVAGGSNLGRIENVIFLFFLLGWFFIVQLFINRYTRKQNALSFFSKPLLAIVVLLFLAAVTDINNNISTAYIDVLTGKAKRYSDELGKRRQLVKQCRLDTCYVPPLTALPATIFFADIKCTADSIDFWMNKAYSAYTGAHYVIVTSPLPPVKSNTETIKDFGKEMRNGVFGGDK